MELRLVIDGGWKNHYYNNIYRIKCSECNYNMQFQLYTLNQAISKAKQHIREQLGIKRATWSVVKLWE